MPCSDTQVNRPRSPFPPPYSTLTPPTSTSSLKETLSGNNINSLIKRPIHVVRRTQSSPDTHQVLQCKPLPKRPLAATNKGDEGVNKTWKQTIFRLTPAQNGSGSRDINTPCRTNPNANTARYQELMPRSMPPGESMRDGMKNGCGKPEEKQTKEHKYPDAKPEEIGDMGMGESNTLRNGSGCKGGRSGDRERLTPEETLWLHRNYRGEATFLKAWGLHITRNDDRERGLEIMRQLMAAEEPKGKDRRRKGQLEKQRDQIGRLKIPTPRDVDGLQAIEEERNSC